MTDNQKEILTQANIPIEWWDNCYITDTNMIFTPLLDEKENILKTGTEVYNE
ncbi:hypothetical protein [Clostridium saccharoperbutylacetonicum]|uniref:hypothetical protein n=1 Tax=Clostridium saccharoperbutylacetonicum TaxID=36745 RepID=UPI0039EC88B7